MRRLALFGAVVCLVVLGACGGGDDDADDAGVAAGSKSTTTTTAGNGTTAKPASAGEDDPWRTNALPYRTRVGEKYALDCPPGGKAGSVWGVETYTADSSICTAAVHVGLITFEKGGEVEYEIAAPQDSYESAKANEVLSAHYGRFDGSFIFPKAPPGSGDFTIGAESWERTAGEHRGKNGERFTYECAAGGPIRSVWGTGTYTDDSSVCSAAVHAGLLTLDKGGKVTVEIAAGKGSYEGTTANGVTSSDYGSYAGSYTFAR